MHDHIIERDDRAVTVFLHAEYIMDLTVAEFEKLVIALVDRLVIGGRAELAQACRYVVISEEVRLAMPGAAIGLFPDTRTSLFFGRCPSVIGMYLEISGCFLGAADYLSLGLAKAAIPSLWVFPL